PLPGAAGAGGDAGARGGRGVASSPAVASSSRRAVSGKASHTSAAPASGPTARIAIACPIPSGPASTPAVPSPMAEPHTVTRTSSVLAPDRTRVGNSSLPYGLNAAPEAAPSSAAVSESSHSHGPPATKNP